MAEGGFDDFEMEYMGRKYPEYDDMNEQELHDEYENLLKNRLNLLNDDPSTQDEQFIDVKERINYIDSTLENSFGKTTFTSNNDGRTITIKIRDTRSYTAPEVDIIGTPENENVFAIGDFIRRNYDGNFKLDALHNEKAIELLMNVGKRNNNNIMLKPLTSRNKCRIEQVVLKRDSNGVLQYNTAERAKKAVKQFKELINEIQENQKDRDETVRNMPMVDTTVEYTSINGLTEEENREMKGLLNPLESIDMSTRPAFLKVEIDHIQDTFDKTIEERNNADDPAEYIELEERVIGLRKAKDLTLKQTQLEEVREQQEEDITRLQRFKKWAKENMIGLSAIAIGIAGIITTIIISARKAILSGAQVTRAFAKALYDLGKKLGPLLAPLLNIFSQVISFGGKGLLWLANNLWVLAVAFAIFIYEQYKKNKNR